MVKSVYVSTPIYYVNDKPHIGHAYSTVVADVIARYNVLKGQDIIFSSGTDEHGMKVENAAKDRNIDPRKMVDDNSQYFSDMIDRLGCKVTDFIRTTEERHVKNVQSIWNILREKQYIYKGLYKGWYSVRDECYYKESELIDGKAPTGAEVAWIEEESYFFALSKFQDKLVDLYENNTTTQIYPNTRKNEVLSFLRSGLEDLSVSRTNFSWGIPVPDDERHVIYVWIDALVNYLTVCKHHNQEFWHTSKLVHVLGKDIIRFHAIYFPALLLAIDEKLPDSLIVHGWWTNKKEKMSKSLKNVVDPVELVNKYGVNTIRYYFIRDMRIGNDTNFSEETIVSCYNIDLANNFGNLLQRTLMLLKKGRNSIVPDAIINDNEFYTSIYENHLKNIIHDMEQYDFFSALSRVVHLSSSANEFIEIEKPWSLYKTDIKRFDQVICILLECLKCIYLCLLPIIPVAAEQILQHLGITKYNMDILSPKHRITTSHVIPTIEPIFKRL